MVDLDDRARKLGWLKGGRICLEGILHEFRAPWALCENRALALRLLFIEILHGRRDLCQQQ